MYSLSGQGDAVNSVGLVVLRAMNDRGTHRNLLAARVARAMLFGFSQYQRLFPVLPERVPPLYTTNDKHFSLSNSTLW